MGKRFLLISLVLSLVFALAACSKGNNETNGTSEGQNASKDGGSDKEAFEIAIFVGGDSTEKFWQEVINDFKDSHPNLEVIAQLSGVIGDVIKPRFFQGSPPDLIYLNGASASYLGELVENGAMEPLDDFVNTAQTFDSKGSLKEQWISSDFNYNNEKQIIGLPFEMGTYGLFYNANLVKEKGWKLPGNWDELIALAEQVKSTEKDLAFINYPGSNALGYLTNFVLSGVAQQDPDLYLNSINMEPGSWTNSLWSEQFNKIKTLRKYELQGSIGSKHTEAQIAWLQGKSVFYPSGSWLEGEMKKDIPEGFEMEMIPFPINGPGEKQITTTYVDNNLMIPKLAKNKEAAKEFFRFLYQDKYAKRYTELTSSNFAMKTKLEGDNLSSLSKSVSQVLSDPELSIYKTIPGYLPVVPSEMRNWYNTNSIKPWADQVSTEKFFADFEIELEKFKKTEEYDPNVKVEWLVKP